MMRIGTDQRLLLSGGLHAAAARTPSKLAIICGDATRSYAELSLRTARATGALRAHGLGIGDRVAIFAPNCLEYPELVLGVADAGCIGATIGARSTPHEVRQACDDCGARVLLTHPSVAEVAHAARSGSVERIIVLGPEYEAWLNATTPARPDPAICETDPFTLVYSSGTTGKPKGVVISHRSRTLTFHAMAMEYGCYGPDDIQLGIAPMAHGAGFAFIMASLYFGGTVDIVTKFDPESVLRKLSTEPISGVFMVPTHFQGIFSLEAAVLERYRGGVGTLRTIMSNAAALPPRLKDQITSFWGDDKLHETYGSTEAGIVTNLRPQDQRRHARSVGHAFALNRVRIVDEIGNDVATGEVGELYSNSPYTFNGYWNQMDDLPDVLGDGWVTAGDLARRDTDGFIYIVDRKNDLVVSGGFNIYPREIEDTLNRHPAVLEAAVIGVPDTTWGEALTAFVVLRAGMQDALIDLGAHCRESLSGYKIPKEFRFVETLPRNAGGKVLKKMLRGPPSDH